MSVSFSMLSLSSWMQQILSDGSSSADLLRGALSVPDADRAFRELRDRVPWRAFYRRDGSVRRSVAVPYSFFARVVVSVFGTFST